MNNGISRPVGVEGTVVVVKVVAVDVDVAVTV